MDDHKQWVSFLKISISLFLVIRLISSLVLLIRIVQPTTAVPNDPFTFSTIQELENSHLFVKLFISPWFRWDAVHYVGIAENGYDSQPLYSVWPPLYPFLIKTFSIIFKPPLLAAIIVSNLFLIFAITLFLKLITELFNETKAKKSLFFLLLFPTSIYLIAPYTESIFLALSLAVIYASIKKKWLLAGILSGFAAITRVQGVFLILPILIEGVQTYFADKDKKVFLKFIPALFFSPLTYGIYCLYVRFGLQSDWPWVSLKTFWGQHFGMPWEGIIGNITALFGRNLAPEATLPFIKFLTVIVTLFSVFFLLKISKKMPLSIAVYSWVNLFLVLSKVDDQSLMISTMRYLLPIFPIFIGQAMVMTKKWEKVLYFIFGVGINIAFLILNYWWIWIA
ncbi:MAG: mannosyltransferase family protein [Anaerolineaceae bacterium]